MALLGADREKRQGRRAYIDDLIAKAELVCVQETHGDRSGMRMLMPQIEQKCIVEASACASFSSGGVATIIRRDAVASDTQVSSRALVPGRVLLTHLHRDACDPMC